MAGDLGDLDTRRREHGDRILGSPPDAGFHEDRSRLLDSVGREAQRVVDGYDRRREAQQIADAARTAVAATAAVGAGAVGLGAIVSVAASTAAADFTGLMMAGVMAALGFLIIPARRRKARVEMREKVSALVPISARRSAQRSAVPRSAARSDLQMPSAPTPASCGPRTSAGSDNEPHSPPCATASRRFSARLPPLQDKDDE